MRRFNTLGALGLIVMVGAVTGCPDREVAEIDPNQAKQNGNLIPVGSNRNIDILFVIDNSGSMGEEQTSILSAFPQFMSVLNNIEGGLPNVHIGVVSSNTGVGGYQVSGCMGDGDNGALQNTARGACTPPSGRFIEDILGMDNMTRVKNYTGTLEDTFTCIAKIGTNGCGFEQHLESMKRALDGSQPANANFLRPDAYLAVIFLADEDDCSAADSRVFDPNDTAITGTLGPLTSFRCTEFGIECAEGTLTRTGGSYTNCQPRMNSPYLRHPSEYVAFLNSLKPDPNLLIVSGIIGNNEPVTTSLNNDGNPELNASCTSANGNAAPGVRLKAFLDSFPNTSFTSICNQDLESAMQKIADLLARVIGDPCLEGNIATTDLNPGAPGLQLECSVEDVRFPGTSNEKSDTIRRCTMDATGNAPAAGQTLPCWYVLQDAACTSMTQLKLVVERGGIEPPPGSYVRAACLAQ